MVTGYTIALLGAALIVFVVTIASWRRRAVEGGLAFILILASITVWCFFSAMETTSITAAREEAKTNRIGSSCSRASRRSIWS